MGFQICVPMELSVLINYPSMSPSMSLSHITDHSFTQNAFFDSWPNHFIFPCSSYLGYTLSTVTVKNWCWGGNDEVQSRGEGQHSGASQVGGEWAGSHKAAHTKTSSMGCGGRKKKIRKVSSGHFFFLGNYPLYFINFLQQAYIIFRIRKDEKSL